MRTVVGEVDQQLASALSKDSSPADAASPADAVTNPAGLIHAHDISDVLSKIRRGGGLVKCASLMKDIDRAEQNYFEGRSGAARRERTLVVRRDKWLDEYRNYDIWNEDQFAAALGMFPQTLIGDACRINDCNGDAVPWVAGQLLQLLLITQAAPGRHHPSFCCYLQQNEKPQTAKEASKKSGKRVPKPPPPKQWEIDMTCSVLRQASHVPEKVVLTNSPGQGKTALALMKVIYDYVFNQKRLFQQKLMRGDINVTQVVYYPIVFVSVGSTEAEFMLTVQQMTPIVFDQYGLQIELIRKPVQSFNFESIAPGQWVRRPQDPLKLSFAIVGQNYVYSSVVCGRNTTLRLQPIAPDMPERAVMGSDTVIQGLIIDEGIPKVNQRHQHPCSQNNFLSVICLNATPAQLFDNPTTLIGDLLLSPQAKLAPPHKIGVDLLRRRSVPAKEQGDVFNKLQGYTEMCSYMSPPPQLKTFIEEGVSKGQRIGLSKFRANLIFTAASIKKYGGVCDAYPNPRRTSYYQEGGVLRLLYPEISTAPNVKKALECLAQRPGHIGFPFETLSSMLDGSVPGFGRGHFDVVVQTMPPNKVSNYRCNATKVSDSHFRPNAWISTADAPPDWVPLGESCGYLPVVPVRNLNPDLKSTWVQRIVKVPATFAEQERYELVTHDGDQNQPVNMLVEKIRVTDPSVTTLHTASNAMAKLYAMMRPGATTCNLCAKAANLYTHCCGLAVCVQCSDTHVKIMEKPRPDGVQVECVACAPHEFVGGSLVNVEPAETLARDDSLVAAERVREWLHSYTLPASLNLLNTLVVLDAAGYRRIVLALPHQDYALEQMMVMAFDKFDSRIMPLFPSSDSGKLARVSRAAASADFNVAPKHRDPAIAMVLYPGESTLAQGGNLPQTDALIFVNGDDFYAPRGVLTNNAWQTLTRATRPAVWRERMPVQQHVLCVLVGFTDHLDPNFSDPYWSKEVEEDDEHASKRMCF